MSSARYGMQTFYYGVFNTATGWSPASSQVALSLAEIPHVSRVKIYLSQGIADLK